MKNSLLTIIKKYKVFIILLFINLLFINLILLIFNPDVGIKSAQLSWSNLIDMMKIIPPIFILLGLMDVWLKKETMIKYMGENSGFIGVLIAFFMGSAAAGPLYAAFPIAALLIKKGSKFSNVLIFIGAWSTTKIPQLLFEASALGTKFLLIRLACNIIGIGIIAFITESILSDEDKKKITINAENMSNSSK